MRAGWCGRPESAPWTRLVKHHKGKMGTKSMEHSITQLMLQLFTALGYGGIVVAMAIESCCIPLPSELIMPLAGFLAVQHTFSLWGAAFAGAVGCVLGSLVAYAIG